MKILLQFVKSCDIMFPTIKRRSSVGYEDSMFRIAICDKTPAQSEQMAKTIRSGIVSGGGTNFTIDCFSSLAELKKMIGKELTRYRLVVMETEVDGEDGVEAAKQLRKMGCMADIVFCTEDPSRALEAYAAYPSGYILKPCAGSDLCDAVTFIAERNGRKPSIILKGDDGRKYGFRVDDIIYIEVFRTELEVHCVDARFTCTGSLREVCEKLPKNRFYRAHRSFIVNLSRVTQIERYQFTMDNGDVVTVAKNRYAEAKKVWKDFCGFTPRV